MTPMTVGVFAHPVAPVLRQEFPNGIFSPAVSVRKALIDNYTFRPISQPAGRKGAARYEVDAQGGEEVGVNGIHEHTHALPVRPLDVIGAGTERKFAIGQGYTSDTRLGKGCLLEAFAKPRGVRTAQLDNYYLLSRVSQIARLSKIQLLTNRDGAEDQENRHAVLQGQERTRHPTFSPQRHPADDRRRLHPRHDQGRIASRGDADQHHQQDASADENWQT